MQKGTANEKETSSPVSQGIPPHGSRLKKPHSQQRRLNTTNDLVSHPAQEAGFRMAIPIGFLEALPSAQKASDLADADSIFDWLIGSWEMDAVLHDADGREHRTKGEVHASWVLEGRAIQDLFIFPRRADRTSGLPARGDRYSTTIRTFDRKLNAWRVNFINPADDETSAELIARHEGQRIMMEGKLRGGTPIRWQYLSVTPTSFHYTAERLNGDDESWQLYLELFGRRSAS